MPDAPISFTPTVGLGQWSEGANPGFAALNENWTLIDDEFAVLQSASDLMGAAVLALQGDVADLQSGLAAEILARAVADTAESAARISADGVESAARIAADSAEAAARIAAVAAEATTRGNADVAEAAARAAADLLFLKLDGTTPMTGDIAMGGNKVGGAADGVAVDEYVTRGQLDAAALAGFDALHEAVFWMLMG